MRKNDIINDINWHLAKSDKKSYSYFYIWITNDIERRLFWEHNVPKKWHRRIHREADSEEIARAVESYYLNKWMKWWEWWWTGNWNAKFVYCYEISNQTRE